MNVTVIGAGVIGLTTASILQSNGFNVKIIAAHTPSCPRTKAAPTSQSTPHYTSPNAGAHWRSVASKTDTRQQEWDKATLLMLFALCKVPAAGLMRVKGYEVSNKREDPWFSTFIPGFKQTTPTPTTFGIEYETVCIDVPVYLNFLLDRFKEMGGVVVVTTITHINEAFDGSDIVVNCTGINARFLGGVEDKSVYPTRGQTVLVRAPHITHTITVGSDDADASKETSVEKSEKFTYLIPRSSGILILGGTFQEGNWETRVDSATTDDIIKRCIALCPEIAVDGVVDVVESRVGLRPTRIGGVRLEGCLVKRKDGDLMLIHNYGHGGYGFQSSWGTAESVLAIAQQFVSKRRGFLERVFSRL